MTSLWLDRPAAFKVHLNGLQLNVKLLALRFVPPNLKPRFFNMCKGGT